MIPLNIWRLLTNSSSPELEQVTRLEIIEDTPHPTAPVTYRRKGILVRADFQDDGRTLKLFVRPRDPHQYMPTLGEIEYVRNAILTSYATGELPDFSGQTPWIREVLDQPDGGTVALVDTLAFLAAFHTQIPPHQSPETPTTTSE